MLLGNLLVSLGFQGVTFEIRPEKQCWSIDGKSFVPYLLVRLNYQKYPNTVPIEYNILIEARDEWVLNQTVDKYMLGHITYFCVRCGVELPNA